jgi:NAD(P)-dependent dehydrogenase (short-subunit alcohol dehydrogenase family)
MGEPDEVARLVALLVSAVAAYLIGRRIFVDGGMTDYPSFTPVVDLRPREGSGHPV